MNKQILQMYVMHQSFVTIDHPLPNIHNAHTTHTPMGEGGG